MSTLKNKISEELTHSMKEKNPSLTVTLRSIKSKITEAEKAKGNQELSDDEVIKVIEKLAKQREESIKSYIAGNREDLANKEKVELIILQNFLPTKMTEAETRAAIEEAVNSGADTMPSLMKYIAKFGSLIDRKLVSELSFEYIKR